MMKQRINRQNAILVNTDGLSITKKLLPGITNARNNHNNTITDDGIGKTPNGGINNGRYVFDSFILFSLRQQEKKDRS